MPQEALVYWSAPDAAIPSLPQGWGRLLRQAHREVLADTHITGVVDLNTTQMTVRAVTKVRPGSHVHMQNEYRRLLKQVMYDSAPAARSGWRHCNCDGHGESEPARPVARSTRVGHDRGPFSRKPRILSAGRRNQRLRRERGQALLEFALVLPLLVSILIAALLLARVLWSHQVVWALAGEAARAGALGASAGRGRGRSQQVLGQV